MLKLNGNISLALGSAVSKKAYLGNTLVYDKTAPIVIEPELQAAIDRINASGTMTLPNETKITAYDILIKGLKTDLLWSKFTNFQLRQFNDLSGKDLGLINLKDPLGAMATMHGDASYTLKGVKTLGVNGYVDNKWNPALDSGISFSSFVVFRGFEDDYPESSAATEGIADTSPNRNISIFPRYGNSDLFFANDVTVGFYPGAISAKRMIYYGRNGNDKILYRNDGSGRGRTVAPISPIINGNYFENAQNRIGNTITGYCSGTSWFFAVAPSFTLTEMASFKSRMNTYLTSIGLNTL